MLPARAAGPAPGTRLECAGENLVWRLEGDASRFRNRSWQWIQEGSSCSIDLPAHQHGIVFMLSVVAVFHVHAAPVTELHGDGDGAVLLQPVHILAASFRCGN